MKKVSKLKDLIFKPTKKTSKLLLQASCVVIFIALFCNASYGDCGCGTDFDVEYTVRITFENRSDNRHIYIGANIGTMQQKQLFYLKPGESHIETYKEKSWNGNAEYLKIRVSARLATFGEDREELNRILLGQKEIVITEFETTGTREKYAEITITYPW